MIVEGEPGEDQKCRSQESQDTEVIVVEGEPRED